MSKDTEFTRGWSWLGGGAFLVSFGLYLLCYALLVAKGVFLHGDDFAYIESIVQTLARGHFYTHDFIGPYNIFFTATGVAAYLLSGNFYLSTYGVLACFASFNFMLLYIIFRNHFRPWHAAGFTMAVVTFPFYLHKSLDYHGCLPTQTCLLSALLSFSTGRYKIMYAAIFLAVATRQNSLFLFLLPLYAIWNGYRKEGKLPLKICGYLVVCLAALYFLKLNININWFNRNLHPFPENLTRLVLIVRQFGVGIFLGIFFLVISGVTVGGVAPLETLRTNFRCFKLPIALSAIFGLILYISPASLVWFQTPLIGSLDHKGLLQTILKITIFISFWFLDRRILKLDIYLFLGLAYVGISCLLGFYWDYYLAELAFIAIWIALLARREDLAINQNWPLVPICIYAAVLLGNFGYAYLYKVLADKAVLTNIVFEKMERQHRISPERMTGATFGFLGFKVFRLVMEDNPNHEQDDFTCYIQGDGVVVESGLPWKLKEESLSTQNGEVLEFGIARIGFMNLPYRVVDHKNPQGRNVCHGEFKYDERTKGYSRPFPLNNTEWAAFIRIAKNQYLH